MSPLSSLAKIHNKNQKPLAVLGPRQPGKNICCSVKVMGDWSLIMLCLFLFN